MMKSPSLKKLLFRKGLPGPLERTLGALAPGACLLDQDRALIWGQREDQAMEHPVVLAGETIGFALGGVEARQVAELLSYLAEAELEKRAVCQDALDKYKEVSLVYALTEKVQASLDSGEVANMVLDEIKNFFKVTHASLLLYDERIDKLREAASRGREYTASRTYGVGEGIPGHVLKTGRAEVVDNVMNDPRSKNEEYIPGSQLCVPLKIKEKCIGVLNVTSSRRARFTSSELKLLMTLASQAAVALENALIYEDLAETCTDAVAGEGAPCSENNPGLSILYVEDSRNNRMLIDFYLRKTPYEVSFAEDGEEGVQYFKDGGYDVVLMDMEMPVLDGYAATRAIRDYEREHALPATPIVALTGHDDSRERHRCLEAGCTEVLSKPVNKQQLFERLKALAEAIRGSGA
jgi:CheY-like chemotaxis protein/putative methionine-R-sulfoxide reductase with GAF domain